MMMSLNSVKTALNVGYSVNIKPRKTADIPTEKQSTAQATTTPRLGMEASEDPLVQKALTRPKPESILAEDLDYRTPLVAFLANPEAIKKQILTKFTIIGLAAGAIMGASMGAFTALLTHWEKPTGSVSIRNMAIWTAGFTGIGLALGALCGWLSGNEATENQAWVNKKMFEMMDLTSPTATLAEGNKAYQKATGSSFTQQLVLRSNEETQRLVYSRT